MTEKNKQGEPDIAKELGEALKGLGRALSDMQSELMVEMYRERRTEGFKALLDVARSPEKLKQIYAAAKSADLNRDGKLEGEAEQAALISAMTGIGYEPFKSARHSIESACKLLPDAKVEALMAMISKRYYRDFYIDKKLAQDYDASSLATATQNYLAERKQRIEDVGLHQMMAPKGLMSDADYAKLLERLSKIDRELDARLLSEMVITYAENPEVREAAKQMPEMGAQTALPSQAVCKAATGLRI